LQNKLAEVSGPNKKSCIEMRDLWWNIGVRAGLDLGQGFDLLELVQAVFAVAAQAVEPIVGANAACYNVTVSPRAQMSHKLKDFALKCRMILRTNALGLH